jgi:periplasmic divalent cation tolerance protein
MDPGALAAFGIPEPPMPATLAYITTKDREEALRIGRDLLERRLAACINILEGMQSVYWWEGRLEEARECVLLVKSDASRSEEIVARVKEMHSYAVPCVVFWPLTAGNPDYLGWIERESGHA